MALMRRQSLVKFDAPLCETIVETPKPQGKEVLVRIERCGLCHSDLHIQDGYADLGGGKKLDTTRGMTLPFTLGHEIAGVVEEVGPEVSNGLIGAKKAVFPPTAVLRVTCWCLTQDICWITTRCRLTRRRP